MREDIYGSLKNALERGATIEQAIRSLINSGYSESEVREVADQITPSALSTTSSQNTRPASTVPIAHQLPRPVSLQKTTFGQPLRRGNRTGTIILLVIILLILLSLLVLTIIFREKIVNFLLSLF